MTEPLPGAHVFVKAMVRTVEPEYCDGGQLVPAMVWLDFRETGECSWALLEDVTAANELDRLRGEKAEAWDEGYEACSEDTERRSAPPGPCGPADPMPNPYLRTAMDGAS